MENLKKLFSSKRFWSALIGLGVVVGSHWGLSEDAAAQITQATELMVGLLIAGLSIRDPGQALGKGA